MSVANWSDVARDLAPVPCSIDPASLKRKSRDFYWYSPVLRAQLDHVCGDLVAAPRTVAELLTVARYCVAHRIPLTARAAGTGTYGQAMPLHGGIVLDTTNLNRVLELRAGVVRAEAGITIRDLETQTLLAGWELRLHPSTWKTATIGGYVAGGSLGAGSINYGSILDSGNVLALKLVTLEGEPRVIELRDHDVTKAAHACGTTGIITEVELPLVCARNWREAVVRFPGILQAVAFAQALAEAPNLHKKFISAIDWGVARFMRPLHPFLTPGSSAVLTMIDADSRDGLVAMLDSWGGQLVFEDDAANRTNRIVPLYEFTFGHAAMFAFRQDKDITYLQCAFDSKDPLSQIEYLSKTYRNDAGQHFMFVRVAGEVRVFGAPLFRFTTLPTLKAIIDDYVAHGIEIYNPHTYLLIDHPLNSGGKATDPLYLAFKRQVDPFGLLNPGKIALDAIDTRDALSGETAALSSAHMIDADV